MAHYIDNTMTIEHLYKPKAKEYVKELILGLCNIDKNNLNKVEYLYVLTSSITNQLRSIARFMSVEIFKNAPSTSKHIKSIVCF